jgi:hypothetical protein
VVRLGHGRMVCRIVADDGDDARRAGVLRVRK